MAWPSDSDIITSYNALRILSNLPPVKPHQECSPPKESIGGAERKTLSCQATDPGPRKHPYSRTPSNLFGSEFNISLSANKSEKQTSGSGGFRTFGASFK